MKLTFCHVCEAIEVGIDLRPNNPALIKNSDGTTECNKCGYKVDKDGKIVEGIYTKFLHRFSSDVAEKAKPKVGKLPLEGNLKPKVRQLIRGRYSVVSQGKLTT